MASGLTPAERKHPSPHGHSQGSGGRDGARIDVAAGRVWLTWQFHEPHRTSLDFVAGSESGTTLRCRQCLTKSSTR